MNKTIPCMAMMIIFLVVAGCRPAHNTRKTKPAGLPVLSKKVFLPCVKPCKKKDYLNIRDQSENQMAFSFTIPEAASFHSTNPVYLNYSELSHLTVLVYHYSGDTGKEIQADLKFDVAFPDNLRAEEVLKSTIRAAVLDANRFCLVSDKTWLLDVANPSQPVFEEARDIFLRESCVKRGLEIKKLESEFLKSFPKITHEERDSLPAEIKEKKYPVDLVFADSGVDIDTDLTLVFTCDDPESSNERLDAYLADTKTLKTFSQIVFMGACFNAMPLYQHKNRVILKTLPGGPDYEGGFYHEFTVTKN